MPLKYEITVPNKIIHISGVKNSGKNTCCPESIESVAFAIKSFPIMIISFKTMEHIINNNI